MNGKSRPVVSWSSTGRSCHVRINEVQEICDRFVWHPKHHTTTVLSLVEEQLDFVVAVVDIVGTMGEQWKS